MKLGSAIAGANAGTVTKVAEQTMVDVQALPYERICADLGTTLKSSAYIQPIVLGRLPPAFSILCCLLEAPSFSMVRSELAAKAAEHWEKLCAQVAAGELLDGDDHRLYRRVLVAAWQTGFSLDQSEMSVLGVLRNELGLYFVDHFLSSHHPDFHYLWRSEDAFDREITALESSMLIFNIDQNITIAEEAAPAIAIAIGVPMVSQARRRLFQWLGNLELTEALRLADLPVAGNKDQRIERIVQRHLPPSVVLAVVSISELQAIAERVGCVKSGSKDSLILRLIDYFSNGRDLVSPEPELQERVVEMKALKEESFRYLFEFLTGRELQDILESFEELPTSGTKAARISNLWRSAYNETTLLAQLQNRQLEDILERMELGRGGSKTDRVIRLIDHANGAPSIGNS